MDDIIVIILTLVVTVFGIFNQQRKKKTASKPASEGSDGAGDFWDMIMDKANLQEEEEVYVPEPQKVVEKKKEIVVEKEYAFTPSVEGQSDISDVVEVKVPKKRKVKINGENFSLKKAVIYQEILNRKYS